jgi:hypothetical protein
MLVFRTGRGGQPGDQLDVRGVREGVVGAQAGEAVAGGEGGEVAGQAGGAAAHDVHARGGEADQRGADVGAEALARRVGDDEVGDVAGALQERLGGLGREAEAGGALGVGLAGADFFEIAWRRRSVVTPAPA